jgi:PAS domain S-box-containing protein
LFFLPVLTTLLSWLLHQSFQNFFSQRTFLIPLVFSVNLCAILGGLAPGLLATALAAGACLWVSLREGALAVSGGRSGELALLALFVVAGVVSSVLCGRLHQLLRRVRQDAAVLRLRHERLQRAQHAGGICTWEWEPPARFMHGCEECGALYGVEPGALLTKERLLEHIVLEDRGRMEVIFNACEGGTWSGHTEFSVLRGAHLSMSAQAERGTGGETTRLLGVTVDVTERRQMELACAKWRPFFAAIGWATVRPTEAPVRLLPETPPAAGEAAPVNSAEEVAALRRAGLLDLRAEAHLDRLTELTCRLLHVPMALVSVIDEERFYFKSSHGLPAPVVEQGDLPLANVICRHLLAIRGPLIIRDTRTHPLVCELDFARLGVVAYLGVPLRTTDGKILGSLCAMDNRVRDWSEDDLHLLQRMADSVMAEIEVRVALRQREESDAARERSEESLRVLSDTVPGFVFIFDQDGGCEYVNERFVQHTGLSAEACLGRGWHAALHPEDIKAVQEAWATGIRGCVMTEVEFRMRDRDDRCRWFLSRMSPSRRAGQGVRWFGICIDIDDRKRLEAQMQEADRRKDEFLAMLAHELRNPLAPILNAVALLQRAGSLEPGLQQLLDVIARQVRHMSRLLDDLLDVSRFVRGKVQLRKEPLQLSAILRQAVEVSRPLIEGKGQVLEVSEPEEEVRLLGDPARLVQVFANLLNNAAKYTGEGGRIWVRVEAQKEQAVVRVKDSGIGMTGEMLSRAFDLFAQADRSLDRSQGGLGIGLALARMLVMMHGGRIAAQSEGPGRGSEFIVWLPRTGQAAAAAAREGAAAQEGAAKEVKRRVLVVDDNTDVADTMKAVLEALGQSVWAVYGGQQALEVAEERRPEIVFLDIGLPGLDGYEVCRRLRHMPGLEGARIIAMSGYGQAEDRRRAREAGFNMHLTKPVDIEQIERIVTEDVREPAVV